jgi:hypothetical protein
MIERIVDTGGEQQINIRMYADDVVRLESRAQKLGLTRTTLCRAILLAAAEGDIQALAGLMVPPA